MRIAFLTVCISPHQLPLASRLAARVGAANFRYISAVPVEAERTRLGWGNEAESWCISRADSPKEAEEWCENADLLFSYLRELDIFEARAGKGLKTVYVSERWFKPIEMPILSRLGFLMPGSIRMLNPSFRSMAKRIRKLLTSDSKFIYYPMGVHAAADMARLCGWKKPVFSPSIPGAWFERMRLWGYFIEPSLLKELREKGSGVGTLKVLWVGRLLHLKRVDTIIRAVRSLPSVTFDIYGIGPDEARLRKYAAGRNAISFHKPVSIDKVRVLMREHDVYVFPSNGLEGWGAVVSEALEEGMKVLGSYEAGASATILPQGDIFSAGDWRRLGKLLEDCTKAKSEGRLIGQGIGLWNADNAADILVKEATT